MNINDFNLTDKLKKELTSVISSKKLPHAIILDRGDYNSRVDFAYFLSAAALCGSDSEIPCGICRDCKKAMGRYHPDISEYEREKNKKEFSVSIVREKIKPSVYVKAGEADGKVCIIKDAETMNASAQNAFLKVLEEPPANVKFILCCDNAGSMLETIRSRATVYSMGEAGNIADEDLQKAKMLAAELAESLMLPTEYEFMAKTGVFEKDRQLITNTLSFLQKIFRDAVLIKSGASAGDYDAVSQKSASFFTLNNLLKLIDKTNELNDFANKNANLNLLLTRLCSCLRQAARG
ncbi:MAG: hypothetical protein MJ120_03355 [Clostridia bacterium]|nr:hypothetical protein [Clostridia bacterium]